MTTWTVIGSIEGPQGAGGTKGDKGDTGLKGDKGDTGATGVVDPSATQTLTNKTISGSSNTLTNIAQGSIDGLSAALTAKVPTARQVTAGTGLTGGGDMTADRSLAVTYGTAASTAAQGNDARLSDARTPLAHSHAASDINSGVLDIARLPAGSGLSYTGTGGGTVTRRDVWTGTAAQYASATKYADRIYIVTA